MNLILRLVLIGHTLERGLVAHLRSLALNHEIEALVKGVTAGRDDTVRVAREVLRFAFTLARAEVQRAIQPDGSHRRGMRASLRTHRRQPVHFRLLQAPPRLRPWRQSRTRATK